VRIMFTGGGGAGTEALWRFLHRSHEIHFADADPTRIHEIVPEVRRHAIPMAREATFTDAVMDLCNDLELDAIVPGVDEELLPLAQVRQALAPTVLVCPEYEFIAAMLDKGRFVEWLVKSGLPSPATTTLTSPNSVGFPCIVKPCRGRGSRGVFVVHHETELQALRNSITDPESYLIQELLVGEEYTVQVVANRLGNLVGIGQARVIEKRGITIHAVSANEAAVRAVCSRIHELWPTTGLYNVQGILVPHRGFVPFEINPRASTTMCLAMAAGLDTIGPHFDTESSFREATSGVELRRFWTNVFTGLPLEAPS